METLQPSPKMRTVQVRSMKYWLLDAVVILTIAATLTYAYGAAITAPACDDNSTSIDTAAVTRALRTSLPVKSPTSETEPHEEVTDEPAEQSAPPKVYQAGDFVEVLEPSIHPTFAFSAQIHHIFTRPDGTKKYIVRPGFGKPIDHFKFDHSTIRDFGSFEVDGHAMCDLGIVLNAELIPCTILEHRPRRNTYVVSFTTREGEETEMLLPISRIRRIVKDDEDESSR